MPPPYWVAIAFGIHDVSNPRSSEPPEPAQQPPPAIQLKDPELAALLAWLVPGLGHLYQGRTAKAVLFAVCVLGTFFYGAYLGSSAELGGARVVYFSWQPKRLAYLCQIGAGLPATPALLQAARMSNHKKVWFGGFMAPPRPEGLARDDPNYDQPTAHKLHRDLHRYFELGSTYTMIAGLLNILAVYDAWGGPVMAAARNEEEEEEEEEEGKEVEQKKEEKEQGAKGKPRASRSAEGHPAEAQ